MADKKRIISIGRQFGSGGHLVAKEIGKKLGIEVYDNELISKAAENSGFSKNLFLENDESRSLFNLSSFFTSGRYISSDSNTTDNILFNIQSQVIKNLAEKDSAIFIGRCSDYLLRDKKELTSIFITAPLEERIRRVMERMDLEEDVAENLINKKDRTRETYYNYYTMGNWGMASNYDLCIDSSILGPEGTADMIIEFIKRKENE